MKNFLQICLDTWEETGLSGSGPTNVSTATGIEKRVVGWVRQAWIDIQQYRNDWPWMVRDFTFNTSPDKHIYPLVELSLPDLERWLLKGASIYKTALGKATEKFISSATYDTWWLSDRIGIHQNSQPEYLFVDPVWQHLMMHPVPDDEYTIVLRYYRAPQELLTNIDVPIIPTNKAWQEIIKWRALYLYAFHDGAPALLDEAEFQYEEMIHAFDNKYGQNIKIAGSPIS